MEGLLWACLESEKFSLGKQKGCGERRWIPETARGGRSPACPPGHMATALAIYFTADFTSPGTERKPQNKKGEWQNRSKTTHTPNRMEGRSKEDGGKKPNLAAALVPVPNAVEDIKK